MRGEIQLTKREELSLRVVLALPNDSSTGLVWTIWSSRETYTNIHDNIISGISLGINLTPVGCHKTCFNRTFFSAVLAAAPTCAKYAMTFFVFSVFPAPDSPLQQDYARLLGISFIDRCCCK
jgi:hypothetical protein